MGFYIAEALPANLVSWSGLPLEISDFEAYKNIDLWDQGGLENNYFSLVLPIRKLKPKKDREFAQRCTAIGPGLEPGLEPGFFRSLIHPDTYTCWDLWLSLACCPENKPSYQFPKPGHVPS